MQAVALPVLICVPLSGQAHAPLRVWNNYVPLISCGTGVGGPDKEAHRAI